MNNTVKVIADKIIRDPEENNDNFFLLHLIEKLGSQFMVPEEEVITQGDETMDMYYITRGDCVISIKGQQEMQVVVEGDHFGEIALVY